VSGIIVILILTAILVFAAAACLRPVNRPPIVIDRPWRR